MNIRREGRSLVFKFRTKDTGADPDVMYMYGILFTSYSDELWIGVPKWL